MDPSSYIKGEEANLYIFSVSNILWKYTDLPPHPLHQVLTVWLPSHEKFKEKNKVWSETNVSKRALSRTLIAHQYSSQS